MKLYTIEYKRDGDTEWRKMILFEKCSRMFAAGAITMANSIYGLKYEFRMVGPDGDIVDRAPIRSYPKV